ncbi:MAG: argininosuccinate lyase [Rhodobacteraceae bacterium]|jgi:hypothetical protein|nr:argininosuccinate lyase [Paracoccaceae bacterium]
MIRIVACVALFSALVACGVDGEPERPEPRPATGITITGTVEVGISG